MGNWAAWLLPRGEHQEEKNTIHCGVTALFSFMPAPPSHKACPWLQTAKGKKKKPWRKAKVPKQAKRGEADERGA
jgi:hypothetical protein